MPLPEFSQIFCFWAYAQLMHCPMKGNSQIKGIVVVDVVRTQSVFDSLFDSFQFVSPWFLLQLVFIHSIIHLINRFIYQVKLDFVCRLQYTCYTLVCLNQQ